MTYHVSMRNSYDRDFDDADACAEWLVDNCTDGDDVEEMLNDYYNSVDVCGYDRLGRFESTAQKIREQASLVG